MFLTLVRCTNLSPTALTEVGSFECSNLAQFSRNWEESLPNDCFNYCRVSGQVRRFRFYYRPPTKLREGNVFTHVCLFVQRGSHVTITHNALDLIVRLPHPALDIRHGTPLPNPSPIPTHPPPPCQTWNWPLSSAPPLLGTSGGHNWRPVQFFFSPEDPPPTHQYWHLISEVRVVVKQAVPILLE